MERIIEDLHRLFVGEAELLTPENMTATARNLEALTESDFEEALHGFIERESGGESGETEEFWRDIDAFWAVMGFRKPAQPAAEPPQPASGG